MTCGDLFPTPMETGSLIEKAPVHGSATWQRAKQYVVYLFPWIQSKPGRNKAIEEPISYEQGCWVGTAIVWEHGKKMQNVVVDMGP